MSRMKLDVAVRSEDTLLYLLEEASDEAEKFLGLRARLKQAKDEDEYLDAMADIDVSASVLKAKLISINREIERKTDDLTDDD